NLPSPTRTGQNSHRERNCGEQIDNRTRNPHNGSGQGLVIAGAHSRQVHALVTGIKYFTREYEKGRQCSVDYICEKQIRYADPIGPPALPRTLLDQRPPEQNTCPKEKSM